MPVNPPEAAERSIALSQLNGFPKLVIDYIERFEEVADYYGADYRTLEARKELLARPSARPRPRAEVSAVLVEQNRAWGMPDVVLRNAEALAHEDTVAVVTGQQVGIFGGPLFTLYKTVAAIKHADELSRETGRKVVPVFWVEGEDHDFDEIASISLLKNNELVSLRYEQEIEGNPGAVGRIELDDRIADLIDQIDQVLPPSDFHEEVLSSLREAYAPGRTIEDAFVYWWKSLFADRGLVFMNPDDRRLKELVAPLFNRELEEAEETARRVQSVSSELESEYHAQVHAKPTNIFLLHDEGRFPIDVAGPDYELRGRTERFTRQELVDLLQAEPERFSPNVILRPLMQDYLLPTAAYVAGPGEISYFAQYRGVYDWAGIPMPGIIPRATATLVESKVAKVLKRYELTLVDLQRGLDAVFADVVRELSGHDLEEEFKTALGQMHSAVNALKPVIESVDASLVKSAEATRASLVKEVDRLKERVFRAEKRHHDEVRAQLEKASVNIFPRGRLQERVLSPLYYFNKYGLGLIDRLFDELETAPGRHRIISL